MVSEPVEKRNCSEVTAGNNSKQFQNISIEKIPKINVVLTHVMSFKMFIIGLCFCFITYEQAYDLNIMI